MYRGASQTHHTRTNPDVSLTQSNGKKTLPSQPRDFGVLTTELVIQEVTSVFDCGELLVHHVRAFSCILGASLQTF